MDNINFSKISSRAVYYYNIDKNKLYSDNTVKLPNPSTYNNKEMLEFEEQELIGNKIRSILSNSKENIKNTVPIINSVNKQLMQDNLLMKIKIENMKQSCKYISSYCLNLKNKQESENRQDIYNMLSDISKKFNLEFQKKKEE